jgi:hypothetical protein
MIVIIIITTTFPVLFAVGKHINKGSELNYLLIYYLADGLYRQTSDVHCTLGSSP